MGYALSGTDAGYAATRRNARHCTVAHRQLQVPVLHSAIALRMPDACPGTTAQYDANNAHVNLKTMVTGTRALGQWSRHPVGHDCSVRCVGGVRLCLFRGDLSQVDYAQGT
eukprot:3826180-Rhodomonas_salina.2